MPSIPKTRKGICFFLKTQTEFFNPQHFTKNFGSILTLFARVEKNLINFDATPKKIRLKKELGEKFKKGFYLKKEKGSCLTPV
ncbi:MAG: hypothetical protein CM15mV144_270 [Caudoviricetes sp.]|nr:MAG: hypothetical protein CM15mV144_270 [Caudoviricetes sp.]